ncbi:hypothetical protein QAD02_006644 [Eretmocerus hayati]|uniref:Uncharacterized protein n=1 Tax=Eretmocerus hayati TaxID=131215 RepID=A0ACC2N1I3_9HYME|nr:hypothetical protein QAD02_006644 [Eretmocerus hayati]
MDQWKFFTYFFIFSILIYIKQAQAILGGDEVTNNVFSYTVALRRYGVVYCSGSIIGKNYVVTAAHCVYRDDNVRFNHAPLEVIANTTNYRNRGATTVIADVDSVYFPNEYKSIVKGFARIGDIAVLKLQQDLDLTISSGINKVFLPPDTHTFYTNELMQFTGYGWDWYVKGPKSERSHIVKDGGSSGKLRMSQMRFTHNLHDCKHIFGLKLDTKRHECVRMDSPLSDSGVFEGDDGGPLVYKNTLVGVLSKFSREISDFMRPAIYTQVSKFRNFIINVRTVEPNHDVKTVTTIKLSNAQTYYGK